MFEFPEFPDWSSLDGVDCKGSFWDSQDISTINRTLIMTVANLREVSRQLNVFERRKTRLDAEYKHRLRKALVEGEFKTEALRKRFAEMQCEDLEFEIAYVDEVIRELNRVGQGLRLDLDVLKTLSFNVRQEMKI